MNTEFVIFDAPRIWKVERLPDGSWNLYVWNYDEWDFSDNVGNDTAAEILTRGTVYVRTTEHVELPATRQGE